MTGYCLTGTLRNGSVPGTVEGTLRDAFGLVLNFTGTRAAGGYDLVAVPGPVPENLRIPFVDDDDEPGE